MERERRAIGPEADRQGVDGRQKCPMAQVERVPDERSEWEFRPTWLTDPRRVAARLQPSARQLVRHALADVSHVEVGRVAERQLRTAFRSPHVEQTETRPVHEQRRPVDHPNRLGIAIELGAVRCERPDSLCLLLPPADLWRTGLRQPGQLDVREVDRLGPHPRLEGEYRAASCTRDVRVKAGSSLCKVSPMAIEFAARHPPTPLIVHSSERTPLARATCGCSDCDRGLGWRKQAKLVFG